MAASRPAPPRWPTASRRGDFATPIELKAGAEGSLLGSVRRMQAGLSALVSGIRTGATEISTDNADLSHRTEAQAAATGARNCAAPERALPAG